MSENNNLPKPIAMVIGTTTSVITLITTIVGLILLWKGNTQIVSTVVLSVGLVGIWGSLFYFRFARKEQPKEIKTEADIPEKKHRKRKRKPGFVFSKKIRQYALIGLYAFPTLVVLGFSIYFYQLNQSISPSDGIVILVANFEGPDPNRYGVTQFITEQTREAISKIQKVQVKTLEETITATQGPGRAIEIAQNNNANILIWGWYVASETGISVTYHVLYLDFNTGFGTTIPFDSQTNLVSSIDQVNTFEFQSNQLADNIIFEVQHAIFKSFDSKADYDNTSKVVDITLEFLEKHRNSFSNYEEEYSRVLASRASLDYIKYGFNKSITAANEAVALYPSYDALLNRASIYQLNGNYDKALTDLFDAINTSNGYVSGHTEAYIMIGEIYESQLEYGKAIDIYSQGISAQNGLCTLINGCHILHYFRGRNYLITGDNVNAKEDFEVVKSLLNDPAVSSYLDKLIAE